MTHPISPKLGLIHRLGLVSMVVPMTLPLAAQTVILTGANGPSWTNVNNWNPTGVPADGTNIIVQNTTSNNTINLNGSLSQTIGSLTLGNTGTRTAEFTLQSTATATLTIGGGVTANGNFTTTTPGLRLRGNHVVSANQTWQVGGEPGSPATDRGIIVQDISASNPGTFVLNGTIAKSGPGQLSIAATSVSGPGDIVVGEGALKLNAGSSSVLNITGPGKFVLNNSSQLLFSKNSGTYGTIDRAFEFNNTASLSTGGSFGTTGTHDIASNMAWNGTHTLTIANSAVALNYRFTGVMSGSGALTKSGSSALILGGAAPNTHNGPVTLTAGELSLDKTTGPAVSGNILVSGGTLRINQPHQIADAATLTVTGGSIAYTANRPETLAALAISSTATSSLSGLNVTGATTISSNAIQELNSGETFTTHSLGLSNNAAIRPVGNATAPATTTIDVGAGGLAMNTGRIILGNGGNATTIGLKLAGDLVSTGANHVSATNNSGPRIIDLQGGARSFAIGSGTLSIQPSSENGTNNGPTIQNGTVVKSGAGTLILSRSQSTADFSLTEGPVRIKSQSSTGNFTHSDGTLLMDVGGAFPAKLITGDFTSTGGSIEITADDGTITPGVLELVRYNGTLTGTPVINIPPALAASRMAPVVNYGDGTDDAITLTSTAVPLALVWHGANGGGLWDVNNTANFNGGTETFFPLDSVTFGDTGANPAIQLHTAVHPSAVTFNHGDTVATYTLSGTGGIAGPAKLTKDGDGTTILATDNAYTGGTDILAGTLQVGNGGFTGSLGTGVVSIAPGSALEFALDGQAVAGNVFTGSGNIFANGPGTVALTANSPAFSGLVSVTAGTLQLGDGGADGSLGTAPIDIAAGATFALKRSGTPTIANPLAGGGVLAVTAGQPILTGNNVHTGGVTVSDGAIIRTAFDTSLGELPFALIPNAIRLDHGGLKNQDSDTNTDYLRGIAITGEAYFTAGWAKSLTIGGPITGTGDVFVNYDSGRVVFASPDSDWNGILTLGASKPGFSGTTGGILEIQGISNGGVAGPLGKASAAPANLVFNGGRLIYNGEDASTDRGFTLQGAGTLEVPFSTLTVSGQATGPGNFTKAGAGTLVLSGSSDFTGEKIVAGGTLVVKSTGALGDTAGLVRFTGTTGVLELAMDAGIAPYPVTIGAGNSGTILSGVATPGPGINHTLGDFALSTVTLNVGASADVSGGSPRVTIPSLNLMGGSAGTTTLSPGTADITLGSASIGANNFAKTLSLGGTSLNNQVTGTIADGINTLSLTKANNSLWTLSGQNTFTGNVTVDNGVLAITHTNALGATAKTLIIAGDAGANRIPEMRLSGGISPVVADLDISGAGRDNATGALRNLSGDNVLTVTNDVTMRTGNGNTTLYSDAGTLTINTPLVTANATNRALTLAGPGNGVINGVIANGSTTTGLPVTKNGAGTWTLNGAHTYTGATTVNEGVLSLGQAALADSAAVTIGENGKLNLNFAGNDRVGSLTINGVAKGDGLYNAASDPGFITGTGSIRVGPEPSGFGTWAAGFGLGENDIDGDQDGDGINNLLEYVLGGIPVGAGASNTSILPTQSLTATDLVLTFRRSDASETDVTLKVQWSDTLGTWNDFATIGPVDALPAVDITEDSPTAALDTVVVTIPRSTAPGGKLFVRLHATK